MKQFCKRGSRNEARSEEEFLFYQISEIADSYGLNVKGNNVRALLLAWSSVAMIAGVALVFFALIAGMLQPPDNRTIENRGVKAAVVRELAS